jgi:acyl-CoA reductase-like NAD-dependent aldehyde dehydrogenase
MLNVTKTLCDLAPDELKDDLIEESGNIRKKIIKEAIGTVFLLSSYPHPLMAIARSLVPAILAGNPILIKPSPYAPLTAARFSKAFTQAGLGDLVQDILIDTKHVGNLLERKEISYVTLAGHSETGRTLYQEIANKSFIDIGLFLSSNNGVYVAEDANINSAVSQIIKAAMENAGQSSYRFSRVFVHKKNYEEFLGLADPLIRSYCIGDPMDDATSLGPITEPDTIDTLIRALEEANSTGGQTICGGTALNDENGKGRFFEPTIITGVDDALSIMVKYI